MDRLRRPFAIISPNFDDATLTLCRYDTRHQGLRTNPPPQTLLLGWIGAGADGPVSTLQEPGGRYRAAVATGCGLFRSTLRSGEQAGRAVAEDGLKKNIETVLSEDLDESTADIDKRLEGLQTELIQKANSKESYDNIVNEIYRLRDLRQETLSRNALRQDKRDRIAEMTDFLKMQTCDITEFDAKLVRKLIERAIVYDDRLVVEFKSGLEIEVNL